jgi:hypothetical protein
MNSALDPLKARLAADPAFAAQFRAAASVEAALAVARAHGLNLDAAMLQNRPLGADELDQISGGASGGLCMESQ